MKSLTENTFIPIGLALTVIGGGSAWLTKISVSTSANAETLTRIESKQDQYTEHLSQIRQDLAVIRNRLENMEVQNGKAR